MIYVASPYSHPDVGVRLRRYDEVCKFVDRMIDKSFVAFSPIVYCHPIAARLCISTDAVTWMNFNMAMLRKAEAMYVLRLDGWAESKGLQIELNVCKMLGIPVAHYGPDFALIAESPYRNVLVSQF